MKNLSTMAVTSIVALAGCNSASTPKTAKFPEHEAAVVREAPITVVSQQAVESIVNGIRTKCSTGEITDYLVKAGCYQPGGKEVALKPRAPLNLNCKQGEKDYQRVRESVRSTAAECLKQGGYLQAMSFAARPGVPIKQVRKYASKRRAGRF